MSDYDGLHLCLDCGDAYTTGDYCTSCAHQRMIDSDPGPYDGGMEDEYDDREPCEKWGHKWSEPDGNGTVYCDRCGETIEP